MAHSDPFDLVGTVLERKYRVDAVIGEGGFGVVYRGFHLSFEHQVAIKCLKVPPHFTPDAQRTFVERFREEGKYLAKLSSAHLSVVRVYDFDVATSPRGGSVPFLVLEWLEGRSLEAMAEARRARGERPLSEGEAIALLRPAVEALAVAHRMGIAHRDVKPANLFLVEGETPLVKVLDFGIAKAMQEGETATQLATRTSSGFSAFSPQYGAPEQFHPKKFGPTGPWTDVHALGLCLVELVSGQAAFEGDTHPEFYERSTSEERPTPRARGAGVSDAFEALCARALARMPSDRFPSAGELLAATDALASSNLARPAPAPAPPVPVAPGPRFVGAAPQVARPSGTEVAQPPPVRVIGAAPSPSGVTTGAPMLVAPRASPPAPAKRRGGGTLAVAGAALALLVVGGTALGIKRQRDQSVEDRCAALSVNPGEAADPAGVDACATLCDATPPRECRRLGEALASPATLEAATGERAMKALGSACAAHEWAACALGADLLTRGKGMAKDEARAAALSKAACDGGHAPSCAVLATILEEGRGLPKDAARALTLHVGACDGGDAAACGRAGAMLQRGRDVPKDATRAVGYLQRACDGGVARACTALGRAAATGVGATWDAARAVASYRAGCDRGDMEGCTELGGLVEFGTGTGKDVARATELYRKACDGGNQRGCAFLGMMYLDARLVPKDEPRAIAMWKRACDAGEPRGCGYLGFSMQYGRGLPKDDPGALALYRKGCDGGDTWSCSQVAFMLQSGGAGVPKDPASAVTIFKQACADGDPYSCTNAGFHYERGLGVGKDGGAAARFYGRACELGLCFGLAYAAEVGVGGPVDLPRAASLYKKSCDAGDGRGCNAAGVMALTGKGVSQSREAALEYFKQGCAAKYEPACARERAASATPAPGRPGGTRRFEPTYD